MEVVIDYDQLSGTQNETIIKELSVGGENVLGTFPFLSPYSMRPHGDSENGWTYPVQSIVLGSDRSRSRLRAVKC